MRSTGISFSEIRDLKGYAKGEKPEKKGCYNL